MAHFDADDFMDELCNERIGELLVQEPEAAVADDPWEHIICSNNHEFLLHAYRWMKVDPAVAVSFDDCHSRSHCVALRISITTCTSSLCVRIHIVKYIACLRTLRNWLTSIIERLIADTILM